MKLAYVIIGAVFFAGPLLGVILGGGLLYGSLNYRRVWELEEAKVSSDDSTTYVAGHMAYIGSDDQAIPISPHWLPATLILVGSLLVIAGGILLLAGPKIIASPV